MPSRLSVRPASACQHLPPRMAMRRTRNARRYWHRCDQPGKARRIARFTLQRNATSRAAQSTLTFGCEVANIRFVRPIACGRSQLKQQAKNAQAPGGAMEPDQYRCVADRTCRSDSTYPQTSLYFNLEVSARALPDKAALIYYDTPLTLRASQARGRCAGRLPAAALRRQARRPRAAVHAEQPAVHDRLLRDPARRRDGGAGQPDEPHRGAAPLRQRQRRHGRDHRSGIVSARCVRCSDRRVAARHRGGLLRLSYRSRPTSSCPKWSPRRASRSTSPACTLWDDALAQRLRARRAALAGPDDLCVMPYTSGTTGKPKGCIHTHRTVMSTIVSPAAAWFDVHTRFRRSSARCRCSTSPACRAA